MVDAHGVKTLEIIRKKLEISKYRMAQTLGISQTQYNYLASKSQSVQLRVLVRLVRELDIPWTELGKLLEDEFGE